MTPRRRSRALAIVATVTTVAVDAATSASSASTAHHALSTAPCTGLRHMPKKWVIAMSVGAGVAAIAIIAALTLGSGDGGHTSAVVVTGDPAQQAALGQAGPGQSSGRASTAAPEGRFAITISGDRSGSIVGTGTCSLGRGPRATRSIARPTPSASLPPRAVREAHSSRERQGGVRRRRLPLRWRRRHGLEGPTQGHGQCRCEWIGEGVT